MNIKLLIKIIISTKLLFGSFLLVYSQDNSSFFRNFSRTQGLSQNSVYHIAQDNFDYIWLATGKGLNRFDGYSFKKYYHDDKNKFSLSSNRVLHIRVDKWNRLWLATDGGLNLFDQKTEKFYAFHADSNHVGGLSGERIKCVLIDNQNYLWVGTRTGLNVSTQAIDSITENTVKNLKFKQIEKKSLSNNLISYLFEDNNHDIWAGTINGLNKIERNTLRVKQFFPAERTKDLVPGNQISSIIQDNKSDYWIATQNGLYILNSENNRLRNYKNHPFFKENIKANHISSLLLDKLGRIWLGTYGNGLVLYHPSDNSFSCDKTNESNPHTLANNHAFYLFEDRTNNLFVSCFGSGFSITSIHQKLFSLYLEKNNVRCIIPANKNNLWVGIQNGGFCKVNIANNNYVQYPLNALKENGVSPTIKCILPDDKDNLWIGTLKKGLFKFNTKSKLLKEYKFRDSLGLKSVDFVFDIKKDTEGNIWIASWADGLFKLAAGSKELIQYKHIKKKNSLSNNNITSINIDSNKIWLTTWGGGLDMFDTKAGKFKNYKIDISKPNSIVSNYCTSLLIDNNASFWIGTTEGLCRFDKESEKFFGYTENEIIYSEIIFSIEEDNQQNLWLSTSMGLSRLNKESMSIYNFDIADGLASNEHYIGSSTILHDGRLLFGGKNGLSIFNPESVNHLVHKTIVNLTNFQLSYKNIEVNKKYNGKVLLKTSINQTDTLYLSHKENVLSFDFSVCDFKKPQSISYAFMLKGFESDWNYVPWNKRTATYTNLSPGQYTLLVKATNNSGVWNQETKKLLIIIKSPFWQTLWFQIIGIAVLILFIISFIKLRTRYLEKQKALLEEKVQERTNLLNKKNIELAHQKEESVVQAEELLTVTEQLQYLNNQLEKKVNERTNDLNLALIKAEDAQKLISSFLSNMSHELRTPMNAISGFTQLLTDIDIADNEKSKYGAIINENIDTLITLVENVMDVAKLHTNQYQFRNSVFNLSKLCDEVSHELIAKKIFAEKEIQFSQNIDEIANVQFYTDPKAFRLIVYNLLENALKYTEKGKISIHAKIEFSEEIMNEQKILLPTESSKKGTLILRISDTGVGIKESEQEFIFEAFKKVEHDKNKLFRGTGLGLALVKNLTEKMHGTISLKSQEGQGTDMIVSIPFAPKA